MAHHAHQSHRGPSIPAPVIPAGTFPPGTLITVGAHKCTIDRYLSEGTGPPQTMELKGGENAYRIADRVGAVAQVVSLMCTW